MTVRLSLELDQSHLLLASENFAAAETMAREALTEAHKLGFLPTELDTSLVLDKIQAHGPGRTAALHRLAMLARTANVKRFKRIARNAVASE